MNRYRLHDTEGDDLGVILHPAPNVETNDIVVTEDDRRWKVKRHVETREGDTIQRLLEVEPAESG